MKAKNSDDLRVIKTKKAIKDAFIQLLENKPIQKITVTELSKQALINKGTFYLHYNDIYDLYREVLSDFINFFVETIDFWDEFYDYPEAFIEHFLALQDKCIKSISTTGHLLDIGSAYIGHEFINMVINKLKSKVFSITEIKDTKENNLKLECYFTSFSFVTFFDHKNEDMAIITKILGSEFRDFFHSNESTSKN